LKAGLVDVKVEIDAATKFLLSDAVPVTAVVLLSYIFSSPLHFLLPLTAAVMGET
jgi:hypothetical protein